jgi:hypothetical protein
LGLLGAGIALRSIRFVSLRFISKYAKLDLVSDLKATKFRDNKKIPKSFIKKNIRLRGIVKSVSTDGTLNIDHIPIISMPWHKNPNNGLKRSLNLQNFLIFYNFNV